MAGERGKEIALPSTTTSSKAVLLGWMETIASECGFTDRSYFQRKFKELTNRTPVEWRER